MSALSKEAINILVTGKGYRCDDKSDLGSEFSEWNFKYTPKQIMEDEINNLGNHDIQDFMSDHYGLKKNASIDMIDKAIKQMLKTSKYNLLWLSDSRENDKRYADNPKNIYKVELPENAKNYAIISDLSVDGCLLALKED